MTAAALNELDDRVRSIEAVLDTMPAAIKKGGEDATDYSPNQVMISGYMGTNSLDAQRNMVLGYSLDGGAQKLVYLKNYIATPSGNDRSTFNWITNLLSLELIPIILSVLTKNQDLLISFNGNAKAMKNGTT